MTRKKLLVYVGVCFALSCYVGIYDWRILHDRVIPHAAGENAMCTSTQLNENLFEATDNDLLKCTSLNITNCPGPKLLPRMSNACFLTYSDSPTFQCLPSVYVAGFSKCGTTQLMQDLALHPNLLTSRKEHHWFDGLLQSGEGTRVDARHNFQPLSALTASFKNQTRMIILQTSPNIIPQTKDANSLHKGSNPGSQNPATNHSASLLVEGTPRTIWDGDYWHLEKPNAGLWEPNELIAHKIFHLTPNARFIVMMRNPADRLVSDYHFFLNHHRNSGGHREPSAKDFHERMKSAVRWWHNCTKVYSEKRCAYGYHYPLLFYQPGDPAASFWDQNSLAADRLRISMYYLYIKEFLNVFPRENFLFIKSEDYKLKRPDILMKQVFPFLGVDYFLLSKSDVDKAARNTNRFPGNKIQIYPETREMLTDFFAPYNYKLAKILNDTKFLWKLVL